MAQNYPDSPEQERQQQMHAFLRAMPFTLPCARCSRHALEYMNERKEAFLQSTRSRKHLVRFLWQMHNAVNARTGKRNFTLNQLQNMMR